MKRMIAESLGVVHRRFSDNEPPVVGSQLISADPARGLAVAFLLHRNADVERAGEGMLPDLKDALAKALEVHGSAAPRIDDIRVTVSSLEAEGIRSQWVERQRGQ
jgi:hypothetical protein